MATAAQAVNPIREGFHTVTPYVVATDGPALIKFVKQVFGAEETYRGMGSAGGVHAEVRIGDSMLMIGGGIPGREFRSQIKPHALHVYVPDTDAVYERALQAGATSIGAPQDHEYGERGAGVRDAFGNSWYIATSKGESYVPKQLHNVNVYLHPLRAEPVINFLKRAFDAEELARYASPDGVIHHAEVRVGSSVVEMGEAHGVYQPMPSMFFLYVNDADAVYAQAVAAGGTSLQVPADQPYGDRVGAVSDPFGNQWWIAAHIGRGADEHRAASTAPPRVNYLREGFHTVTPCLFISGAGKWLEFVKQAFGAEERLRHGRPGMVDVIRYAEVKIGDSMIQLGDATPEYPPTPCTLLLRVDDPDAVYDRAVEAGATAFDPVKDQPYGSRGGTVVDPAGNRLHISKPIGPGIEIFKDFRSVTPHLYATRPVDLIEFLKQAFGGEEIYRAQMPDGRIPHAQVRIGDSIVALAGGQGAYTPMPSTLHLYVADTDAAYERALRAGAGSIQPPADRPYGDRSAEVTDPFGNRWFIATHLPGVQS